MSVEEMFEPCKNIGAGATILSRAYDSAVLRHGEGQAALQAALSAYNTGSLSAGFTNGYVARYFGQAPSPEKNPYSAPTAVPFALSERYWDEPKKEITTDDPENIAGAGPEAGDLGDPRTGP